MAGMWEFKVLTVKWSSNRPKHCLLITSHLYSDVPGSLPTELSYLKILAL